MAEKVPAAQSTEPPKLTAEQEKKLLDSIDHYIALARDQRRWWIDAYANHSFDLTFHDGVTFDRPEDTSFGYLGTANVGGGTMNLMGNYQEMLYDKARGELPGAAERMRDQVREFALRYFMRVSDYRLPGSYVPAGTPAPPPLLSSMTMCPAEDPQMIGFNYTQVFYKDAATGEVKAFSEEEGKAIVDLREMGSKYEWVLCYCNIFNFTVGLEMLGANLSLPMKTGSYVVITPDLVTNRDNPSPDELGRYGIGYAFVKNPFHTPLAYGPGEFTAAFETIEWVIKKDGTLMVEMVFASDSPERIVKVPNPMHLGWQMADVMSLGMFSKVMPANFKDVLPWDQMAPKPVYGMIQMANLCTMGYANKALCLSKESLLKIFAKKHFKQHYETINGSRQTWRQIPDWTDAANLPEFVRTGRIGAPA